MARAVDPDADSPAITELCAAAAIAEYGTPDVTLQLVRESYETAGFDPQTDARLVLDATGNAAAIVEYYDNSGNHVAPFVYLRVRPDLLESGIGDALLRWAEERGTNTVPLAAPDLRVALHGSAAGVNRSMQSIFERSGWRLERVFWTMEIDLGDLEPPEPGLPDGIRIRPTIAGQDEPAIHAAEEEAFADHYGYLARPYDAWLQFTTELFPYDPGLWFLAMDGDAIAGIALCHPAAPGRPDVGWVQTLGVRPAWRKRGLGLTLLRYAFRELHRRGQHRIALGVDAQSITGATRLYERAGMHVTREQHSYERVLREGREVRPVEAGA